MYSDSPVPALDSQRSSAQHAVYVQDEIKLARWMIVNAGLRYDGYENFVRVTPRVAVIVLPSATQSVKYLYGNAFRAPNAYELNAFYFGDTVADLRPESIDTHELVWERYINDWLRTSASTYWYKADRLITLVPNDSAFLGTSYVNQGKVRAKGLELEAQMRAQRAVAGADQLRTSERRRSGDQCRAAEFAAAHDQGADQLPGPNRALVRRRGRPVSQQPGDACRRENVIGGPRPHHRDPATRALLGALRRRTKYLRCRVRGPGFRSAPAGHHPAERPNGPDRASLEALDEVTPRRPS